MFGSLQRVFRRRPGGQTKPEPRVSVTVECPWEHKPIERLGIVGDVLGERTLDEVVRQIALEHAGKEDWTPGSYRIRIRRSDCEEFEDADGQIPARSLLRDRAESSGGITILQLRIQVIPASQETAPGRPHDQRHSDCAQTAAASASSTEVAPCSIVSDGEVAVEPTATVEAAASPPKAARKPHSYLRKTDVLRAHLLPKIEALDLSGLFAGNFGSGSQPAARSPRVSLLSPPEANRYLMMANQHRRAGEHDKAAEYYRALIAHDPDNQDYWFLLGKVEEARHDFKQAMHAYQNALRLGHGSARAEIARIESEHGAVAAAPRDLLSMWRPTYPPADSQAGGN